MFDLRPVFSGHETFPLRYGWLKKVYDACLSIENDKNGDIVTDLFNNPEAIVTLGVGKNMVASMRYWSTYACLLEYDEDKRLRLNDNYKVILDDKGFDPYLENSATLWYIHWNLVGGTHKLFTYRWFFNFFNYGTFDKELFSKLEYQIVNEFAYPNVSTPTLKRDRDCFLSVYAARNRNNDEESLDSPLSELELVHPTNRKDVFTMNRGKKPSLSIYSFIFGLLLFWNDYSPASAVLSFESICNELMSPGRVFLLNEDAIMSYLEQLSKETKGNLEYTETAGMKQVILRKAADAFAFRDEAFKYFRRNYR